MAPPTEVDVIALIQRIATDELELGRPIHSSDALVSGLDLDSLRMTILAVALEDHFRIKLSSEEAAHLVTVADLARLVIRLCGEGQPC